MGTETTVGITWINEAASFLKGLTVLIHMEAPISIQNTVVGLLSVMDT